MPAKYTKEQLKEVDLLVQKAKYCEVRFKEYIQTKNPLFLIYVLRIIWISFIFKLKFKDEYLKAKYKTYGSTM